MDINKNNLDTSTSPYLKQHKDNPIHWQEWSPEILEYARSQKKPIFVSIGYATCHWCHVMAHEAFSDAAIADFLNSHFISIKVDRESQPDLDHYFMQFSTQQYGVGGWPLNVFLTPEGNPFFAITYVGTEPQYGLPDFLTLLHEIFGFAKFSSHKVTEFKLNPPILHTVPESDLIQSIESQFDSTYGGFGSGAKFPPYTTLLFLMHYNDVPRQKTINTIIQKTLGAIALGGLHDHLQGGFFRYTVDPAWNIPHFEKMLYDQAMLLWTYSIAYKYFNNNHYKDVALKIIESLTQTFEHDGVFYSAHDADTKGVEGATYIWTNEDLVGLSAQELKTFNELFDQAPIKDQPNSFHLIKKEFRTDEALETKLLSIRKKRSQPFTDKKIITSWNALTGIALIIAYRMGIYQDGLKAAQKLFKKLKQENYENSKWFRSSIDGSLQHAGFLEDYASILLLVTYLHEDTRDYLNEMGELQNNVLQFKRDSVWYTNNNSHYKAIVASDFDHPTPSSISLAEYGLLRVAIVTSKEYKKIDYHLPMASDFYNLAAFISQGNAHIIGTPQVLKWNRLPLNSLQHDSTTITDCYKGTCKEFDTKEKLYNELQPT